MRHAAPSEALLPHDVLVEVLARLDVRDIASAARACRTLAAAARDDSLWTALLVRDFGSAAGDIGALGVGTAGEAYQMLHRRFTPVDWNHDRVTVSDETVTCQSGATDTIIFGHPAPMTGLAWYEFDRLSFSHGNGMIGVMPMHTPGETDIDPAQLGFAACVGSGFPFYNGQSRDREQRCEPVARMGVLIDRRSPLMTCIYFTIDNGVLNLRPGDRENKGNPEFILPPRQPLYPFVSLFDDRDSAHVAPRRSPVDLDQVVPLLTALPSGWDAASPVGVVYQHAAATALTAAQFIAQWPEGCRDALQSWALLRRA